MPQEEDAHFSVLICATCAYLTTPLLVPLPYTASPFAVCASHFRVGKVVPPSNRILNYEPTENIVGNAAGNRVEWDRGEKEGTSGKGKTAIAASNSKHFGMWSLNNAASHNDSGSVIAAQHSTAHPIKCQRRVLPNTKCQILNTEY